MDNYLKKVGSAPIRIIIIIILEFEGLTDPEILAPAGDCLALLEIMFASLTFSIIIMIIKKCLSPTMYRKCLSPPPCVEKCLSPHLSLKMFVNKKCLSPPAVCKKCLSPRGETNCFSPWDKQKRTPDELTNEALYIYRLSQNFIQWKSLIQTKH